MIAVTTAKLGGTASNFTLVETMLIKFSKYSIPKTKYFYNIKLFLKLFPLCLKALEICIASAFQIVFLKENRILNLICISEMFY